MGAHKKSVHHYKNFMEALANLTEQLIVLLFVVVELMIAPLIFIALDFWAGSGRRRRFQKII